VTKDEFTSLPVTLALGLVYDLAASKLSGMPAPDVPRPPKYDGRLGRKKGLFCWMSEMTLDDLEWWHAKKSESAGGDSQWSERDGKTAATLGRWIEWRRLFPSEQWSGLRGEDRVTAALPSRDVTLHEWPRREQENGKAHAAKERGDDDGF
jgi:hypothetical protein